MTPILTKAMKAEAAIAGYRIVKPGAADGAAVQATTTTEPLMGVADRLGAASGATVDVHMAGIAEVEFGGNVTRGDFLTADASGRAVAAAPGAGVNVNVIGRAMVSGASGDIGSVMISQGRIQG